MAAFHAERQARCNDASLHPTPKVFQLSTAACGKTGNRDQGTGVRKSDPLSYRYGYRAPKMDGTHRDRSGKF